MYEFPWKFLAIFSILHAYFWQVVFLVIMKKLSRWKGEALAQQKEKLQRKNVEDYMSKYHFKKKKKKNKQTRKLSFWTIAHDWHMMAICK